MSSQQCYLLTWIPNLYCKLLHILSYDYIISWSKLGQPLISIPGTLDFTGFTYLMSSSQERLFSRFTQSFLGAYWISLCSLFNCYSFTNSSIQSNKIVSFVYHLALFETLNNALWRTSYCVFKSNSYNHWSIVATTHRYFLLPIIFL